MAKYTNSDIQILASRMRNNKEDNKPISFLTGAGCSESAGIPLASDLIKTINEEARLNTYLTNLTAEQKQDYGHCMSSLAGNKRKELLNQYLDNATLNWGHIALASMIHAGYVKRVLTFNFDNILTKACGLCGIYPATYDYALSAPNSSDHIVEPAIIHLHGQGHGLVMLNTDEETNMHSELVRPIIQDTLSKSEVIVIGYSGEADNAFEVLKQEFSGKEYLYWCSFEENSAKHVSELLNSDPVTEHFGGVDADDFLVQLAQELGCFPPKIFADPVAHLRAEIKDIIPFNLQDSGDTDVKQSLELQLDRYEDFEQSNKDAENKLETKLQNLLLEGRTAEIIKHAETETKDTGLSTAIKTLYNQAYSTEALKSNDFEDKISLFEKAIIYQNEDFRSYNNWGVALKELKKFDEAQKVLDRALALSPKNAYNMACLKAVMGQPKECEVHLNTCLENNTLPSVEHILKDDDFSSVRDQSWFTGFIKKVERQ